MAACRRQVGQCNTMSSPIRYSVNAYTHILIILLFFVQFSWQQKDPLKDFPKDGKDKIEAPRTINLADDTRLK
jgi:hypothetical protein